MLYANINIITTKVVLVHVDARRFLKEASAALRAPALEQLSGKRNGAQRFQLGAMPCGYPARIGERCRGFWPAEWSPR